MKKKPLNKKIGILGYGEIGRAIAKFYKKPFIKDLNRDDGLEGCGVLHVCIPYNKKFETVVKSEIKKIKPELVIIHSTTALGSTKKIISGLPKNLCNVVHSPVRGMHPHLYKGIKTFVKYIGAEDKKSGDAAKKHLQSLGIRTKVLIPSKTSEALKLWDTTQYAWMIMLNKEIKKWCNKNKVDFEAVYTDANISYNKGYKKLGRQEVIRPYLRYMPGKVGGHCVISNCKILDGEVAKQILKKNNSF